MRAKRAEANFEASVFLRKCDPDLALKLRKCYSPAIGLNSAEMFTLPNPTTPLVSERLSRENVPRCVTRFLLRNATIFIHDVGRGSNREPGIVLQFECYKLY